MWCATTSQSPRARFAALADGLRARPVPERHHAGVLLSERAPASRPEWIEVVQLKFPSGRTAEETVPRNRAALVWMANLACLELHPHPVRAEDFLSPR